MFGMKAAIACLEKGLSFELEMVPFDADDRYRPKHEVVLRVNPKAQVPVLLDGDVELFDSTQIFEYLDDAYPDPPLWPKGPAGRARARQLELISDEIYFPQVVRLMHVQGDLDGDEARSARQQCSGHYRQMDAQLSGQDYLAGEFSYADIAFFMAALFGERMSAVITEETPRLISWRTRMAARSAVREGVAPLVLHLQAAGRPVPEFLA
jgi:glutathione S-transferase